MDTTLKKQIEKPIFTEGITLTKEVALAIAKKAYLGETYSFRDTKSVHFQLEREEGVLEDIVITAGQYDTWINRERIIEGLGKSLKQVIEEAREKRRREKHKAELDEIRESAKKSLQAILDLPIYDTSVMRHLKRDAKGKLRESGRTTVKQVSAPLVSAKMKGLTFALERLDTENFSRKDETKNTHIVGVFSLADLRQKSQEQE